MATLRIIRGTDRGNLRLRHNVSGCLVAKPRGTDMKKAFTLIELLVVMVIAAVIMAIALPGFFGMSRSMAMRGETANIHAKLALCRQWAITHREKVIFSWFADHGTNLSHYCIAGEFGTVATITNKISEDVMFVISDGTPFDSMTFDPMGQVSFLESDKDVSVEKWIDSNGSEVHSISKYVAIADRKSTAMNKVKVNWFGQVRVAHENKPGS